MIEYIAEAGQTMRGDVGLAVEMVHQFAEAGATQFKVQMLDPDKLVARGALSYWQTGPLVEQHQSFIDNGVIPHTGWDRVRAACYEAHVGFVATPFDLDAMKALADLEPAAVKVASGDITYLPLLRAVGALARPVYLSTGASTIFEVRAAINELVSADGMRFSMVAPLACTLRYPTPVECSKLSRIRALRAGLASMWSFRVGYSDHTQMINTAKHAVLAGAVALEKHVTMFPGELAVPDDRMGLSPRSFKAYVESGRYGEQLLGEGTDPGEDASRVGARRSARFTHPLPPSTVVVPAEHLSFLRPDDGSGRRSIELASTAGLTTTRAVDAGEVLSDENVAARRS